MLAEIGLDVRLQREPEVQRLGRRRAGLGLQPCLQVEVERVGDHARQTLVVGAQQHAVARERLRQRQQVERGLLAEHLRRFHDREAERLGEQAHDLARFQAAQTLQFLDERTARLAALRAGACQRRRIQDGDGRVHDMSPARSKIGMYNSTTMAPTTRPIAAISSGSNVRVNLSIQRPISPS